MKVPVLEMVFEAAGMNAAPSGAEPSRVDDVFGSSIESRITSSLSIVNRSTGQSGGWFSFPACYRQGAAYMVTTPSLLVVSFHAAARALGNSLFLRIINRVSYPGVLHLFPGLRTPPHRNLWVRIPLVCCRIVIMRSCLES